MGIACPLHEILNAVSAGLDSRAGTPVPLPANDFDAFLQIDALLFDLNKRYLDAKAERTQAEREFGSGGMTDLAVIAEDSAWCAMQTRYMELRADRDAMIRAAALIEAAQTKARDEKRKARESQQMEIYALAQVAMMARKSGADDTVLWLAILWIAQTWRPQQTLFRPRMDYNFNRLAA